MTSRRSKWQANEYAAVAVWIATVVTWLVLYLVFEIRHFLDYAGIVIGGFSLLLALYAMADQGRIIDSLSTRYVDSFPEHLARITKLVEDAEESIIVFLDCVDYGSMYPKLHARLLLALEEASGKTRKIRPWHVFYGPKIRTIDVTFLVSGTPKPISRANGLYQVEENSTKPIGNETIKKYYNGLKHYPKEFTGEHRAKIECFGRIVENEQIDLKTKTRVLYRFLDIFQYWEMTLLRDNTHRVHIVGNNVEEWMELQKNASSNLEEPINFPSEWENNKLHADFFFWMRDQREAVLLFPRQGEEAIAFITKDVNLTNYLYKLFDDKYRDVTGHRYSDRPTS